MNTEYRFFALLIGAIVIAIVLVGIGGYSLYQAKHLAIAIASPSPTVSAQSSALAQATTAPLVQPQPSSAVLGVQTKTTGCIAQNGLPDSACTPGATFSNVTTAQICTAGYATRVRNVSTAQKDAVYAMYGITSHSAGQYEVDHLISLELGGSNDMSNLWPEAANPRPGYHEKDIVENYLHQQVCNGNLSLTAAQQAIASNWLTVYNALPQSEKNASAAGASGLQ